MSAFFNIDSNYFFFVKVAFSRLLERFVPENVEGFNSLSGLWNSG